MINKSFLFACLMAITICSCNEDVVNNDIIGCLDSAATNYNPNATVSDNNCTYDFSRFIGNFEILDNCRTESGESSLTYTLTIELSDVSEYHLKVTNLMGKGHALYSNVVSQNLIEFPEQTVSEVTYRGNAELDGDKISGTAFGSPDSDCTFSGKKS